jgi:hypothetical protein
VIDRRLNVKPTSFFQSESIRGDLIRNGKLTLPGSHYMSGRQMDDCRVDDRVSCCMSPFVWGGMLVGHFGCFSGSQLPASTILDRTLGKGVVVGKSSTIFDVETRC